MVISSVVILVMTSGMLQRGIKMKEPTEAQRKEFWEWCGLSQNHWTKAWFIDANTKANPQPNIDLNNLFKYAVPGLGFDIKFIEWVDGCFEVELLEGEHTRVAVAKDEDPALALFWALWEVMEKSE